VSDQRPDTDHDEDHADDEGHDAVQCRRCARHAVRPSVMWTVGLGGSRNWIAERTAASIFTRICQHVSARGFVGGVFGRLFGTGWVVGVAGVATIGFAGVGDCGAVFVVLVGGHSIAFLNKSDRRQRLSGGVDAVPPLRQLLGCAVGRGGFGLGGGLDERQ
jgi:hypothetical protein